MSFELPFQIENCVGERIVFQSIENTPEGDKLILEGFCQPGCGPIMHTHFLQDEHLEVVSGKMGYELMGQDRQFLEPGESITFKRGVAHKFWAEGDSDLHCKGWIMPANSVVFYLSSLYNAQNKSGSAQPEAFDGAYLMTRYANEYDVPEIPGMVKRVIFPATYHLGKILGKYRHFKDAPVPL